MKWKRFKVWLICKVFGLHGQDLIHQYEPMVTAMIFTGKGFEEKFIPNPFKQTKLTGKFRCFRCGQVSIRTLRIA